MNDKKERISKLRHFITCLKCEVSGKSCDDNCATQYEAGTMGEIIENLETISKMLEQEPKTGHWNEIPKYKDIAWQCSECEHFTTMKHNYCPNCGRRMRIDKW